MLKTALAAICVFTLVAAGYLTALVLGVAMVAEGFTALQILPRRSRV